MTVSTTDSVIEYVSGGPAFPIPYRFLQNSDIEAVLVKQDGTSETLTGAQYTLSGAGSQNGGTLTSSYAAGFLGVAGASLTISRVMDPVQPTDLRNQGKFLAETHETVFDRLTMLVQQGFSNIRRALLRPIGKNYFDAENRRIANVADPVLGQDAATKDWSLRSIADIIDSITGNPNLASNVFYQGPDGLPYVVQDMASYAEMAKGAALIALYGQGTVQSALKDVRRVEDFGPVGLGNDTATLMLAFAWLNAKDGRQLEFEPSRTYIQGPGPTPVVYESATYYPCRFDFPARKGCVIKGNGATIQADPTLADNQFNRGLKFVGWTDFTVQDLTYDGRLDARTPFGGDLWNGGNELTGNDKSGLTFIDCQSGNITRSGGIRCMMDGIFIGGVEEIGVYDRICRGLVLLNCKNTHNYRQGMSIVGGSDNLVLGGNYSFTGALGATKGTLPMAGIDIEANFADRPNINNVLIGAVLEKNYTGLAFSFYSQSCTAIGCRYLENRAYGVIWGTATDCKAIGGSIKQTLPSTELERYAIYMVSGADNVARDMTVTVAKPHRGAVIRTDSTRSKLLANTIIDETQVSDGSFNQFLLEIQADTVRCEARGNILVDAVGLGWHARVLSGTAIFTDNRIGSKWGASGGGGVDVVNADAVYNNVVDGVNPGAGADGAGVSLNPAATRVRQLGPNIDGVNPRIGGQIRRVGFIADVIKTTVPMDFGSIPAGGTVTTDVAVPGTFAGDFVQATLDSGGSLYLTARVAVNGSVRITVTNPTASAIDPPGGNIRIVVTAP